MFKANMFLTGARDARRSNARLGCSVKGCGGEKQPPVARLTWLAELN